MSRININSSFSSTGVDLNNTNITSKTNNVGSLVQEQNYSSNNNINSLNQQTTSKVETLDLSLNSSNVQNTTNNTDNLKYERKEANLDDYKNSNQNNNSYDNEFNMLDKKNNPSATVSRRETQIVGSGQNSTGGYSTSSDFSNNNSYSTTNSSNKTSSANNDSKSTDNTKSDKDLDKNNISVESGITSPFNNIVSGFKSIYVADSGYKNKTATVEEYDIFSNKEIKQKIKEVESEYQSRLDEITPMRDKYQADYDELSKINNEIYETENLYNAFLSSYEHDLNYDLHMFKDYTKEEDAKWIMDKYGLSFSDRNKSVEELNKYVKSHHKDYLDTVKFYEGEFDRIFSQSSLTKGKSLEEFKKIYTDTEYYLGVFNSQIKNLEHYKELAKYDVISQSDDFLSQIDSIQTTPLGWNSILNDDYETLEFMSQYDDSYVKMYNYLYNQDKETAKDYLHTIRDELNQYKGMKKAQDRIDKLDLMDEADLNIIKNEYSKLDCTNKGAVRSFINTIISKSDSAEVQKYAKNIDLNDTENLESNVQKLMDLVDGTAEIESSLANFGRVSTTGLGDGLYDFGEGFAKIFSDGEVTAQDYEAMIYMQYLQEHSAKYADVYQTSQAIGNMIPVTATGVALTIFAPEVAPFVTSTMIGLSSFGTTKNEMLVQGYDAQTAFLYAAASSGSDAILEVALGGIGGVGVNAAVNSTSKGVLQSLRNYAFSMIQEGGEEVVQNFVQNEVWDPTILGKTHDPGELSEDYLKTFVQSMIISGVLNSGTTAVNVATKSGLTTFGSEEAVKAMELVEEKGFSYSKAYDYVINQKTNNNLDTTNALREKINMRIQGIQNQTNTNRLQYNLQFFAENPKTKYSFVDRFKNMISSKGKTQSQTMSTPTGILGKFTTALDNNQVNEFANYLVENDLSQEFAFRAMNKDALNDSQRETATRVMDAIVDNKVGKDIAELAQNKSSDRLYVDAMLMNISVNPNIDQQQTYNAIKQILSYYGDDVVVGIHRVGSDLNAGEVINEKGLRLTGDLSSGVINQEIDLENNISFYDDPGVLLSQIATGGHYKNGFENGVVSLVVIPKELINADPSNYIITENGVSYLDPKYVVGYAKVNNNYDSIDSFIKNTNEEYDNLKDFFKTDSSVKQIMFELQPPLAGSAISEDSVVAYTDDAYDNLKYVIRQLKQAANNFDNNDILKNKVEEISNIWLNKFAECGTDLSKLSKFYRDYVTNMDEKFVDDVKKELFGYAAFKNPVDSLKEATTINEVLHLIHSYITNDDLILQSVNEISSISLDNGEKITLYGKNSSLAQSIINSFPKNIDIGETTIVSFGENEKIIMMIRDLAHALTIEIDPNENSISYFLPKVCNITMVNNLPGINKVRPDVEINDGATGKFFTNSGNIVSDLFDFINKVPGDGDMLEEDGFYYNSKDVHQVNNTLDYNLQFFASDENVDKIKHNPNEKNQYGIEYRFYDTTDLVNNSYNRVFETNEGLALGRSNPYALHTKETSVYRKTGMDQINDIVDSGYVKSKGYGGRWYRTGNVVYWSKGSDKLYYYDFDQAVLEVDESKVKNHQAGAISIDDLSAIWVFDESQNKYVNKLDYYMEIHNNKHMQK